MILDNWLDIANQRPHRKKGELTVSYAKDVGDALIKSSIEQAGYTVSE